MKKPHYYLYATGFDSSITMDVSGGLTIQLTGKKNSAEVHVPVAE